METAIYLAHDEAKQIHSFAVLCSPEEGLRGTGPEESDPEEKASPFCTIFRTQSTLYPTPFATNN